MIYTILILKNTGETLYSRNIGAGKWDEHLTSGFISAAYNFTQNTFGAGLDDIELGSYKLLFERRADITLVAFFDKFDSIINIREILIKLGKVMEERFGSNLKDYLCNLCDFDELGGIIEKLISESKESFNEALTEQYKGILDGFRSNAEILDCDLISHSGIPLTKNWQADFLELCLRMIDAFWKSQQYVLDQIILSYQQRTLILTKVNDQFILSALIRRNTPLGVATFLIDETVKILAKLA